MTEPQIKHMSEIAWEKLSADLQAQHILSNSSLYQQVMKFRQLIREFTAREHK